MGGTRLDLWTNALISTSRDRRGRNQSIPFITKVVSSNPAHGGVYSISGFKGASCVSDVFCQQENNSFRRRFTPQYRNQI